MGRFTLFVPALRNQSVEPESDPRHLARRSSQRRARVIWNKQAVRHRRPQINPIWNSCVYLDLAPIEGPGHHPRPELHSPKEKYFAPSRKKPVTRLTDSCGTTHVATAASAVPPKRSEAEPPLPMRPHLCHALCGKGTQSRNQMPRSPEPNHPSSSNESRLRFQREGPRNPYPSSSRQHLTTRRT